MSFNFVRQEVHDIAVGVHVVTAGRENVGAVVSPLELTVKKRVLILEESVMMLSIRSANRTDVTLLETLIQEMAEFEKLPNFITEEALARDGFGPQPAFGALIAELDGQPAGYAFFFYCYSTFRGRGLFLEDLFVRSQFRSRKVGDALLSRVAAIARAQNCFGIMLNVLAWNQPAIKFFQKRHAKFLDDRNTACLDADALQILTEAR